MAAGINSKHLFSEAKRLFPGGVNSPVRAFKSVGGDPLFISRAKGAYLWDADDRRYTDYVGSWGPAILGHAHPEVVAVVQAAAERGFSFGAPTANENLLAQEIQKAMPAMEKLRFVSSGTEACMSAIRLARASTSRSKIVKFAGHYHGHADMLLAQAGSGLATLSLPDCAGVPAAAVADTLVLPFNDVASLEQLFKEQGEQLACVIIEPIAGNVGFIRPVPGYLEELRRLCTQYGVVLIFDEVMTGFRVARGGMQALTGIVPDLCTLGKVIGGGLPLAAYGGRQELMDLVAPLGPVYQAGTLSGNPLATACGLKTLQLLAEPGVYEVLAQRTRSLVRGLVARAHAQDLPLSGDSEGGMFAVYFRSEPVLNFADAQQSQVLSYASYFHGMLSQGVYLAPSAFEAGFVSLAHTDADVQHTFAAAEAVFASMRASSSSFSSARK